MRKLGLFLTAIGLIGFLAGVSALAGRPVQGCDVITTVCCVATAITGYRIFSEKKRDRYCIKHPSLEGRTKNQKKQEPYLAGLDCGWEN